MMQHNALTNDVMQDVTTTHSKVIIIINLFKLSKN